MLHLYMKELHTPLNLGLKTKYFPTQAWKAENNASDSKDEEQRFLTFWEEHSAPPLNFQVDWSHYDLWRLSLTVST